MFEIAVPPLSRPLSLFAYLRHTCPAIPAGLLRRTLKARDVRVNGQKENGEKMLVGGELLAVYLPAHYQNAAPGFTIIYEDDDVLIVDKPFGLCVEGESASLVEQIEKQFGAPIYPCHRLDANTTGLVALARNARARDILLDAFKRRLVDKRYHALLKGCPEKDEGLLVHYAVKHAGEKDGRAFVKVSDEPVPGAKTMKSHYRVLKRLENGASRVEITLFTGRTHQIRAQFAHIGHPVVGDDLYGDRAFNRALGHRVQQLRAVRLAFALDPGTLDALRGRVFSLEDGGQA